VSQFSQFF